MLKGENEFAGLDDVVADGLSDECLDEIGEGGSGGLLGDEVDHGFSDFFWSGISERSRSS